MPVDPNFNPFEYARGRIKQSESQKRQEEQDALKRRFAQLGRLSSGASIKAEQEAADLSAKREQEALGQVDVSEQMELQRRKELEEARQFATSEREATQTFATKEREAGQTFQSGMADREFQNRKDLMKADQDFRNSIFQQEFGLAEKEFKESRRANLANLGIALKTAGIGPGEVERLMRDAGAMLGYTDNDLTELGFAGSGAFNQEQKALADMRPIADRLTNLGVRGDITGRVMNKYGSGARQYLEQALQGIEATQDQRDPFFGTPGGQRKQAVDRFQQWLNELSS